MALFVFIVTTGPVIIAPTLVELQEKAHCYRLLQSNVSL